MSFTRLLVVLLLAVMTWHSAPGQQPAVNGQQTAVNGADSDKRSSITSLPPISRAIHDAMQSRDYATAVKQIESALGKKGTKARDYLLYLQGVALTEAEQYDAALVTLEKLVEQFPDGEWASRARFGKAHIHVLRRQYTEAGEIYALEAERLLSRGRKDDLAQIYLEFADRYFDGIPTEDPSQAKQPDYQQALTYYTEAVKLGPTIGLRQQIEFRIARCQQELQQNDNAIASYQSFLQQHGEADPTSETPAPEAMLAEVRYQLGLTQLAASLPTQTRRTWRDFIEHWDEHPDPPAEVRALLAKAEYRLSHTYGLPQPPSVGDLELAVTLAERFLERYPDHPLAAVAELEIAQGFANHARHQQSVKRLRAMIDNPTYRQATQIANARRMLGQEYLRQAKFNQAIEAWAEFLNQHPTDPQWPNVQKRIVDTEFARAEAARAEKSYDGARTLWQTFLNKYPLDSRAPAILLRFGEMKSAAASDLHQQRIDAAEQRGESPQSVALNNQSKTLFEEAIADWRRVVTKYPQSNQASQASLMIGITLENRLVQLAEALESYKKVQGQYAGEAQQRITRLTSPQLQLVTERKFRTDETPRIRLTSRNLKNVTVRTYQIDMSDYFRKMHLASGIESLDIALIDPDQQFEHALKDYQDFKQITGDIEIPTLDGPGVTAVTVNSDELEATTMVVVSDLDMIAKSSRNELFLFVQDMLTGQPAGDVSILVSDGSKVFSEATTAADGTLQQNFAELKSIKDLRIFAIREGHIASTVSNLNGLDFAVGLSPKGYLYTDRPAYRSGQLVNLKGIVRWVNEDRFTCKPNEQFTLDVFDSRGRQLHSETVTTNAYGTIHSNLLLPQSAAQGEYRVQLHRPKTGVNDSIGELSFETTFEVTEYRLEPVEIAVETEKQVYFRGESVKGTISLNYYYGTPLANQTVEYRFGPEAEIRSGTTDDQGKITFEFETQRFSESQPLLLRVDYRERGLATAHTVYLATRGFEISVSSLRDVFINGETFETIFKLTDPAGEPVTTDLHVEVFQQISTAGQAGEKLVATHQVTSNAQLGEARQALIIDEGGVYIIRGTATDQFGNQVSGQHSIRISGEQDNTRLRILADQLTYEVGDQAEINLHWREAPALALVTFEGAKVLGYELVDLRRGNNPMQWNLQADYAPNVFVSVAVMQRNQFHVAETELQIARQIRIAIRPERGEVRPGDDLLIEIETTDPQGNPIPAELSLALVEANLLSTFSDRQSPVDQFFHAGRRRRSVRQATSCTFQYKPRTQSVNKTLREENNRRETEQQETLAWRGLRDGESISQSDPMTQEAEEQFANDMDGIIDHLGSGTGGIPQQTGENPIRFDSRRNTPQSASRGSQRFLGEQLSQVAESETTVIRGEMRDRLGVTQSLQSQLGRSALERSNDSVNASGLVTNFGLPQEQFRTQQQTLNGLTAKGRFLTLNANDTGVINRLQQDEGMQVMPTLARSETAFWDPTLIIDESGKTQITITMPDRSTAWALRAKGVTPDTLAGETTAKVITKKELFGEMKLPLAFTVGDKINVPVEIHHLLEGPRTVEAVLKMSAADKSTEQRKTMDVQGPGITKIDFEISIEEAKQATFELQVTSPETATDKSQRMVNIRPYGFPVYETASGSSNQSTVAMIGFGSELPVTETSLQFMIGADTNHSLIESVLGGYFPLMRCGLPTSSPTERSVSDVIGGIALLDMISKTRQSDTPQSTAIGRRITSAVAQLLSSQNSQGGWAWNGLAETETSDPYLSARVMWSLGEAKRAGFVVPQDSFAQGKALLQSSLAAASQTDLALQTILLHSLTLAGSGDFSVANRLYRERNRLNASGLIHLALSLDQLKRPEMARDLIPLIKIPAAAKSTFNDRTAVPWMRNRIELQALYLLLLQSIAPNETEISTLANSLLGARVGSRWAVEKANGPAIAAVAKWLTRSKQNSEKYRLTISVNDHQWKELTIDPEVDGSQRWTVPTEWLQTDKPQRIEIQLEGRATFSYSAVLTGSVAADKIKSSTNLWTVSRRFEPAQRRMDGKTIPRGFQVVDGNYKSFSNPLTQLPTGQRTEVTVSPRRMRVTGRNDERYDYLVLTEPIPAGCTVLDGSITGAFERYEIEPGRITFFIGNRRHPGDIRYSLVGYTPGVYRAPQSIVRSFYDPSLFAVSNIKALEILAANATTTDEYRLTPDELYHFGQRHFQKADYVNAHKYLSDLYTNWLLDRNQHKNVAQWLFTASLALQNHGDTVKYFEELKEKFPDIEVRFEDILRVAHSYRELAEYERSYLVYRATVEGSFERENQVAGFLNARNEFARSVEIMEGLLRDYPRESYVATATYAVAQETFRRAPTAARDAKLKAAGLNRVHMIDSAIQMLDHFVTSWPEDPAADQASFALATALIDLEQFDTAIERCDQYADRYPDSRLVDSYWYIIGYSHFELGNPDEALAMCRQVAEARFKVAETGGTRAADNRWEATYIMGQVYHSLGQASQAIAEYTKVKERFADAAEAIRFFNRKDISLEEVTTIRPDEPKQIELSFRNVRQAAIKVYRIDLLKFGLMQRNLDRITAINLAGIKPHHEQTVALGDGNDFRDRTHSLELPLQEQGAYLIVCRGENLYASGLVLVSPLSVLVQQDPDSGRVRVSVKDATEDSFVRDVHIKVIGSANDDFVSGDTDLRGLMIADDIRGNCTVIAAGQDDQYAFFRGYTSLQDAKLTSAQVNARQQQEMLQQNMEPAAQAGKQSLRNNLYRQNNIFQEEQQQNYIDLLNNQRSGIKSKEAF
ncbi:MAG: tetratricopeptide repeat protein [Rubripirellula sp.]|nr:tetratricopeptide repeat protein [Rubripirellula sp.]